jgi:3-hydroxyacyl-[acyl-carrier-protein] dehydratase
MAADAIKSAIPHRDPFLLVDEIVEQGETRIVCRKRFTGDEFWYAGHYPEFPITPGVLLCEAAMQAGAVLLSNINKVSGTFSPVGSGDAESPSREKVPDTFVVPVATRMNNVKFRHIVRPGDTIELKVELIERLADAYFLKAAVTVHGKTAATLDFACKLSSAED